MFISGPRPDHDTIGMAVKTLPLWVLTLEYVETDTCASQGLATVVRGNVDKPALEKAMQLRPDRKVVLAQTVGYPR